MKHMSLKFFIAIIALVLLSAAAVAGTSFSYLKIAPQALGFKKPMTYLVLMQNNYEIRATGGYIGSFAIVTMERGKIKKMNLFNTNEFDKKSAVKVAPPSPLKEFLHVQNWQLRDSNWSPDFPVSAKQAMQFYNLQSNDKVNFDGVIAVNTNVLPTLLGYIGSVKIEGTEFKAENAALALEYEVEQGFYERGLNYDQRKKILFEFIKKTAAEIEGLSTREKIQLTSRLKKHLNNKDILVYFEDETMEEAVKVAGWGGDLRKPSSDYLMIVDSNLGALKSDLYVSRDLEYYVDLTNPNSPWARLTVRYNHQAKEETWLTKDYRNFLRVYVPRKAWLVKANGASNKTKFENGKANTVFSNFMDVELNQQKKVVYEYVLPKEVIKDDQYELLIQKQSGVKELPIKIVVVSHQGVKRLWPNKFGVITPSKKQTIFKKTLEGDEVFRIKFSDEKIDVK